MRQTILVTGATSHVGRQVVTQLLQTSASVRALVRDVSSASLPDGTEVVSSNLTNTITLHEHLEGAEAVFLMWPFPTIRGAAAVLDTISKHTRRIVYLSSMSVHNDLHQQGDPISELHADIENLIEQSGLEWTFLRPSGLATNTLVWAPQIRANGVIRWPYGAAARSLIHEQDIAAVAVRTLTEDGHVGAKYDLTGPEALTQVEQVHTIGEVIGRQMRYDEITPKAARKLLLNAMGVPPLITYFLPAKALPKRMVDSALDSWASMVTEPERVTTTVKEITGAPAHTFREWVTDHVRDFRSTEESE